MKKYPELPLKEMTDRRLKNMYQSQLCDQLLVHNDDTSTSIENIQELPTKKNGHPPMTGNETDKQIRD